MLSDFRLPSISAFFLAGVDLGYTTTAVLLCACKSGWSLITCDVSMLHPTQNGETARAHVKIHTAVLFYSILRTGTSNRTYLIVTCENTPGHTAYRSVRHAHEAHHKHLMMRKAAKGCLEASDSGADGGGRQAPPSKKHQQCQSGTRFADNKVCLLPAVIAPELTRANNIRKSCDNCVRLKRACNGESPCRNCARMGKLCSRSAKKRSGPPKGTKYQARKQSQVRRPSTHQQMIGGAAAGNGRRIEADPPAARRVSRLTKRRTDDGEDEECFVRRVASKIHHNQLDPLRPPAKQACAEQPVENGDAGVTRPAAIEVDDGLLLLLRTMQTAHPPSGNLGFAAPLASVSCKINVTREFACFCFSFMLGGICSASV